MAKSRTDPFSQDSPPVIEPALYPLRMEGTQEAPEGLLSWVVGLAQAHCLGPRTLIKHLVNQSDVHSDLWSDAAFFERHCGTVNGLGRYARMMLELVSKSSASAAQDMTLLGLSHLLPANGEGLLTRNPRWCQACLCDQVRLEQRPHHSLVWAFEHYRVCHVHQVSMSEHCPACGITQAFLPIYPSLLHCGTCGKSLVASTGYRQSNPGEKSITEFEVWSAHNLAELISHREVIGTHGSLAELRKNLERLAIQADPSGRKSLCTKAGLQPRAINGWLSKEERPSLHMLLRLCFGLGLRPVNLLLPNLQCVDLVGRTAPATERQPRPQLGVDQVHRMQKLLDIILADPDDHRGLFAVAAQLGLSRHALKYWFPQAARYIVLKNRACEDRKLLARQQQSHALLRSVMQELRAQGIYPSRRKINTLLEPHRLSLARPDLLHAYQSHLHKTSSAA